MIVASVHDKAQTPRWQPPGRPLRRPLDPLQRVRRQLWLSVSFFGAAVLIGTLGYMAVEGWNFLDSLYMTVITLSTVGYSETRPLGPGGRVFTIFLILSGVAALGNLFNQIARAYAEGYFAEGLRQRRLQRQIARMEDHYIVCGYGRIGQQICQDLLAEGAPTVLIERDAQLVQAAREAGLSALQGDASADHLLSQAGIERAACVLCALPSDAENLYIVVSAKLLNPRARTIVRAASEEGAAKLARVGADQIVSPYLTGAKRMAALALRPQVVDLMEAAASGTGKVFIEGLQLAAESCPLIGQRLGEARLQARTGAAVVALRRASGTFLGAPGPDVEIQPGDLLICVGTGEQLRQLSEVLLPRRQR